MPRRSIAPIIPRNEQEHRIYHGNLILAKLDPATALGEAILDRYFDREPLGMGSEKVVYPDIDQEGQVVAFYQKGSGTSAAELARKYFMIKLMHLLWPSNIPDAHSMGTDPLRMHLDMVTTQPPGDGELEKMQRELRAKIGAVGIFLDPKRGNYLLANDGNLKYVDDFGLPDNLGGLDAEISKIENVAVRNKALEYAGEAHLQLTTLVELKEPLPYVQTI